MKSFAKIASLSVIVSFVQLTYSAFILRNPTDAQVVYGEDGTVREQRSGNSLLVTAPGGMLVNGVDILAQLQVLQTEVAKIPALQAEITALTNGYVGSIKMWGGSTPPTGWLECKGQSTNGYPKLAAIFGPNLPDFRGQFVRGWSNSRTNLDAGRALLSVQGHATAANGLEVTIGNAGTHSHANGGAATISGTTGSGGSHSHTATTASGGGHTHTGSASTGGGHTHSYVDSWWAQTYTAAPGTGDDRVTGGLLNNAKTTGTAGSHSHTLTINTGGAHTHTLTTSTQQGHSHSFSANLANHNHGDAGLHSHSATLSSVHSETRGTNVAVMFIVKADY